MLCVAKGDKHGKTNSESQKAAVLEGAFVIALEAEGNSESKSRDSLKDREIEKGQVAPAREQKFRNGLRL